jgi:hypothetical protein
MVWHNAIQKTVDCHRPSLVKLLDKFQFEQNQSQNFMLRYLPGGALFEVIGKVACAQISNMRMVLRISLSDRSQYHSHVADLRTRNFANDFK